MSGNEADGHFSPAPSMLSFFFHRDSLIPRVVEGVGALFLAASLFRVLSHPASALQVVIAFLLVMIYAFFRACAMRQWYSHVPRTAGMSRHFWDALTVAAYVLTICCSLFLWLEKTWLLLMALVIMGSLAHVHVLLILFHLRDSDPTPVNFYSSGCFLLDPLPASATKNMTHHERVEKLGST